MAGETLSPSPVGRDRTFPDLLELFAASMLRCRVPDDASRAVAARARDHARSQVTQARSPLGSQQMLALRAVYDEVRALVPEPALEATGVSGLPASTRAARAFEAMLHLRHRQRAAVLLHDLGGLPSAIVAGVLGVSAGKVLPVVEAARAAIGTRTKVPMNVRHALRDAGRRLIDPAVAPEEAAPTTEAARLPRPVVRALVGPAVDVPAVPVEVSPATAEPEVEKVIRLDQAVVTGRRVVPTLFSEPDQRADETLRALEAAPTDITYATPTPVVEARPPAPPILREPLHRPTGTSRRVRVLLVAAIAALTAVVVPAAARAPRIDPAAPRVSATITTPVVEPVREAAPSVPVAVTHPVAVVAKGDSLWRIAERHLGDPYRWPEIWRLNRGAAMTTGRFRQPGVIEPGWRLRLPAR